MRFLVVFACLFLYSRAGARKPEVIRPARPFDEAAAAFYPEVNKLYEFYRRWAAGASGADWDSCRTQYTAAIRKAFNTYRTDRRRELAQTGIPATLELRCGGNGPRTCQQEFTAPTGREWDTAGMRVTGRPLAARPGLSVDKRRVAATLEKRGDGLAISRIALWSRQAAAAIEQQIDGEQIALRKKLEIHSLPSDATLARYHLPAAQRRPE